MFGFGWHCCLSWKGDRHPAPQGIWCPSGLVSGLLLGRRLTHAQRGTVIDGDVSLEGEVESPLLGTQNGFCHSLVELMLTLVVVSFLLG